MNPKPFILPIVWDESNQRGLVVLTGLNGIIEVYQCSDNSWRVFFSGGHATSVADTKERNIPTREEAITFANKWWNEWLEPLLGK